LPKGHACSLTGGFLKSQGNPAQEHVGIDATAVWSETRPESQRIAQLEIVTTYEPLAKFSRDLWTLLAGTLSEAKLEGE
jgi:hypothetical protein